MGSFVCVKIYSNTRHEEGIGGALKIQMRFYV